MARKLRIEFAGAIYHVLNRGNYRRDLFQGAGEAQAFQTTLAETTARYGWRLHAFAIMRNHYHLAIETPEPNLSLGMHWLQSTFGTRFNRYRDERGHLFQGRFQALMVENEAYLARLVDYIHLNPLRAGIVSPEQLGGFRWGSLNLWLKNRAFKGMCAETWLDCHGLAETPEGWADYLAHLLALGADEARQKECGFETMSRGWAIGTAGWRKAMAKQYAHLALNPGLPSAEARELREAGWQKSLEAALKARGKRPEDLAAATKCAPWKLAVAKQVRKETGAPVVWLADQLHLGSPNSARVHLSRTIREERKNEL
ncbi:MAG: transposase [Puniceicoccaceae bacterium]|nr:MAG: transposase [Puniceicoccaceae bacterium]